MRILQNQPKKFIPEEPFTRENIQKVRRYLSTVPQYGQTPLYSLAGMAETLGVKAVYTKDEGKREPLHSFKILGAQYALSEAQRRQKETKIERPEVYVCATDGNHGLAVSYAAYKSAGRSVVFLPKTAEDIRCERIREIGHSLVVKTEFDYDATVRFARRYAQERNYYFIQDTSFEDCSETANDILLGYTALSGEIFSSCAQKPTHIFLQAGVGMLAASVLAYCSLHEISVTSVLVEGESAPCCLEAVKNNSVTPVRTQKSLLDGLNCGTVSENAFPILSSMVSSFIAVDETLAHKSTLLYENPVREDPKISTTPTGAVPLGVLRELMLNPSYQNEKQRLHLDENAVVLLINTESAC